jgi:hypothetical protein
MTDIVARPRPAAQPAGQWFESDPLWFKKALFYEIHLRGFYDGNADGSGDFRGLTEKLDYLQWLGVDCIWLLPMYASPLRDGGYDIADYEAIHPDYGTIDDVREFLDAAHQRGIRVIADLVMNHTSNDHQWFQESRKGADNPYADWYVWSDTDESYPGARIIFTDTETSNWTWDPVAGAYYWHRFASGSTSAWTGSASTPCRTCTSARAPTARTSTKRTRSCARSARWSTRSTPTRCCWRRPTSGRRTSSTTSARATSATWRSTSP